MKKYASGLLTGAILATSITTFGASNGKTIQVFENVKRVVVNKVEQKIDSKTKPFVYNGTTYVPLKFIADALGESVSWEGSTGTIYIGDTENATAAHFGTDVMHSLWDREDDRTNTSSYKYSYGNTSKYVYDNLQNKYTSYIVLGTAGFEGRYGELTFPLNGQYSTFKATLGVTNDYTNVASGILKIKVDGREVYNKTVNAGDLLTPIQLNVKGANNITFVLEGNRENYSPMKVGLFNPELIK